MAHSHPHLILPCKVHFAAASSSHFTTHFQTEEEEGHPLQQQHHMHGCVYVDASLPLSQRKSATVSATARQSGTLFPSNKPGKSRIHSGYDESSQLDKRGRKGKELLKLPLFLLTTSKRKEGRKNTTSYTTAVILLPSTKAERQLSLSLSSFPLSSLNPPFPSPLLPFS